MTAAGMMSPADMSEEVRVRAGNVHSFKDISAFRSALQGIPGATDVRLIATGSGTIEALVHYEGVLPIEIYLKQLQTAASAAKRIPEHISVTVS
jgi:hypothetical protein